MWFTISLASGSGETVNHDPNPETRPSNAYSPPCVQSQTPRTEGNLGCFGGLLRPGRNWLPEVALMCHSAAPTPAMAAGLADHVWTCEEIAAMLEG